MLASSLSLFGPVVICLVFYLRWQLGEAPAANLACCILPGAAAAPPLVASHGASAAPTTAARPIARARASGVARGEPEPEPKWLCMPGVYIDVNGGPGEPDADATSRGRRLAERIIEGRFGASELPRRGKKGALDVIVVGANLLGISATVHLMQAGWRVLLIARHSWAPLDADHQRHSAARPDALGRLRLPLVTGHHVSVVAQRADGMLEVQAECAAWYTANVIFATHEAAAPANDGVSGRGLPLAAGVPAASRAA